MKIPQRVIKALRNQDEKQPKDYDLCAKWGDTYIDVVLRYDDKWRVSIGQVNLGDVDTRKEAIIAIENFRL